MKFCTRMPQLGINEIEDNIWSDQNIIFRRVIGLITILFHWSPLAFIASKYLPVKERLWQWKSILSGPWFKQIENMQIIWSKSITVLFYINQMNNIWDYRSRMTVNINEIFKINKFRPLFLEFLPFLFMKTLKNERNAKKSAFKSDSFYIF